MRPITAKLESRRRISLTGPIALWFLIIGVSLFDYSVMMGYVDLDRIIDSLWPFHDRMTLAWYKHWKNGEYKSCTARNDPSGIEDLKCEKIDISKDGDIFTVRFKGRIHMREIHKDWLEWKCRNNGDSAVLRITCWPQNQ